ncbi:MAG: P1 family peptidase [Vicinamibacterales bacterium]|nr:P1 family peptidase [Vicinamibacterales bacterium]
MRLGHVFLVASVMVTLPSLSAVRAADDRGLTAVAGVKVGHYTRPERPTGCTVVLVEAGAVGGVDVRGAAPGTRETELLRPANLVDQVHAIVLAGGSAFGLDAASGVMRYLEERQIGFPTAYGRVPIVPAAILFDLGVGGKPGIRPDADCGYAAAKDASDGPVGQGSLGAGAGATVGKLMGPERSMKGGIGSASITLPNGIVVAALVAVNAFGDVVDPATGRVVAGVRTEDGLGFADARLLLRAGATITPRIGQHTTLGVVATNARLTKAQATKVAEMAHDGLARVVSPIHTMYDGDAVFALATGRRTEPADVTLIGALAADVVAEAVLRAVREATGLPGLPAVRDLPAGR